MVLEKKGHLINFAWCSDIYHPIERGTAMGCFLAGTAIGPAFGPFIGGIVVTYTSWRVIFYVQTILSFIAAVSASTPLLPETIHHKTSLASASPCEKIFFLWSLLHPLRVLSLLFSCPNLIVVSLSTSAILWNMYSLLTPIRYVLNPRFELATPLQGGLFYLAPGCGYLLGSVLGGRYADYMTKLWITKRNGIRLPEDRLRAAIPFMGFFIPVCVLAYGWGVQKNFGGIPLVVTMLFLQGIAQLFSFSTLNTYCLDVIQNRSAEVVAGNYLVRYLFACAGTAVVLPVVEAIGVGWFSTISAGFLLLCAVLTLATIRWGERWRQKFEKGAVEAEAINVKIGRSLFEEQS